MNTKEYRIGNSVLFTNKEAEVVGLSPDSVIIMFDNGYEQLVHELMTNTIIPIPLSEERLLQLGFTIEDSKFCYEELHISNVDNDYYLYDGLEKILINGIHHLQNLFYALKGKELTLK